MAKAKKRVVKRAKTKVKARAKAKKVILPMVPSKLIKIALADLKKAEKLSHKYTIDMGDWYNPDALLTCLNNSGDVMAVHKVCSVCFAGAVMAFSLPKKRGSEELNPEDFSGNTQQLQALNCLRSGEAATALGILETFNSQGTEYNTVRDTLDCYIPNYDALNSKPFHKAMEAFRAKLAKAGY